jgi:hypothetical protein
MPPRLPPAHGGWMALEAGFRGTGNLHVRHFFFSFSCLLLRALASGSHVHPFFGSSLWLHKAQHFSQK